MHNNLNGRELQFSTFTVILLFLPQHFHLRTFTNENLQNYVIANLLSNTGWAKVGLQLLYGK